MKLINLYKTLAFTIILGFSTASISAQATQKIGGDSYNINPAAILELESTTKGFLLPRMTSDQMLAILSPPAGMMVYCTNCGSGIGELRVRYGNSETGSWGIPSINLSGDVNATVDGAGSNVTTIQPNKVISSMIDDGTIVNADINNGAGIDGIKIVPDFGSQAVVTTGTLSARATTTTGITNTGNISTTTLEVSGLTTTAGISATDVLTGSLTVTGLTTTQGISNTGAVVNLGVNAIQASEIENAAVTSYKIANVVAGNGLGINGFGNIDVNLYDSSLEIVEDGLQVKNLGITTAKIADAAVTTGKILDGTIVTIDIANNAVSSFQIAAAVAGDGLLRNSETGNIDVNLSDSSLQITEDGLQVNSSGIATAKIADGAVTTGKILDGTITTIDITVNAITTALIANSNVTYAKIQNVTPNKVLGRISDSSGIIEEIATSGTGNVVMSTSPTLTGLTTTAGISATDVLTGTLTVSGLTTTEGISATDVSVSSLRTSLPVFTNDAGGLVSRDIIGSGDVVMSISPTLTGLTTTEAISTTDLTVTGTTITQGISATDVSTSGSLTVTGLTTTAGISNTGAVVNLGANAIQTSEIEDAAVTTAKLATGVLLYDVADEPSVIAAQTDFILSQTPSSRSKVKMYINGVRITNAGYVYSLDGSTPKITYDPVANGKTVDTVFYPSILEATDRVQFDYAAEIIVTRD